MLPGCFPFSPNTTIYIFSVHVCIKGIKNHDEYYADLRPHFKGSSSTLYPISSCVEKQTKQNKKTHNKSQLWLCLHKKNSPSYHTPQFTQTFNVMIKSSHSKYGLAIYSLIGKVVLLATSSSLRA